MSKEHIGQYLKRQLDKKGISQTELVKLLGVSRQTINKHINKGTKFKLDNYIKLSEILDIPIDNLVFGGKGRPTELKKFAQKPIGWIDVEKVPEQPDGLGNTLLDYVIEMDSLAKFKLFYENKCFIEPLHNHSRLLAFLVKHEEVEFLSKYIESSVTDRSDGKVRSISCKAEFPVINYTQGPYYEYKKRNNFQYDKLNDDQIIFIDAMLNTKSSKILDMIRLSYDPEKKVYPHHFYWALDQDKLFIFKYYYEKIGKVRGLDFYDMATRKGSTKIAKYLFEKMDLKSLEKLRKIKDTKYKKEWKEKLGY